MAGETINALCCAEAAGLRVCTGEDHPYCCTERHVEQPDGNAVHRDDVTAYQALTVGVSNVRKYHPTLAREEGI